MLNTYFSIPQLSNRSVQGKLFFSILLTVTYTLLTEVPLESSWQLQPVPCNDKEGLSDVVSP